MFRSLHALKFIVCAVKVAMMVSVIPYLFSGVVYAGKVGKLLPCLEDPIQIRARLTSTVSFYTDSLALRLLSKFRRCSNSRAYVLTKVESAPWKFLGLF